MANSYLNIVTFLLTTVFYYMAIKPTLTYDVLNDNVKYKEYVSNSYLYLAIYLLLVMVIQFIVNASIISTTCGGSISENMGAAGVFTFIPWTLIFGIIVIVLIMYPGFKSAFSDVIGYFYVSSSANKLLTDLLVNTDLEKKLSSASSTTEMTPTPDVVAVPQNAEQQANNIIGGSKSDKEQMQDAADLIIKICGNTSILINQIVPSNFNNYWSLLTPLKKDKYKNDSSADTIKLRDELFDLVVTRDNIGESLWYVYTGLLLTSIVQLKITSRGCASNPKTMQQNYQKFLDKEDEAKAKQEQSTSTTYTITN
jgi:hypothetical protein